MKSFYILLILFCATLNLSAQDEEFKKLKNNFDRFRNEEKNDSALLTAKQMSVWALKNEGDTSLKYAISFRYIGNIFSSLQKTDSAFYYYITSIAQLKKQYREIHADYAGCFNNLGILFYKIHDYKSAEIYFLQAAEIRKKLWGEQNFDYLTSITSLGFFYREIGNYNMSEQYYKKALVIQKTISEEQHPDYAEILNSLGVLYEDMKNNNLAEQYFKQALEIRKKFLGELHPDYLSSLNNLAVLYNNMGDYKLAQIYYRLVLDTRKMVLGELHADYASSIINLGNLYLEMGDYKAAETYYGQALEIQRNILGEQHPDYASSINNLAVLYVKSGEYKLAETYYRQSLGIRKKVLGELHPDYASSINNLGNLYFKLGDYKLAETYYRQALEIRKKVLGAEHPDYASSLISLANLFSEIGNFKLTETYLIEALEIRKRGLGDLHPDYASSLIALGSLYLEMGDYKAAETYYGKALEIQRNILGEQHPDYASSINNLAVLYLKLDDYKLAETYYRQSLGIRKKVLGEQHPDYASSINNLGVLYFKLGDYKAAETYYGQALEIQRNILGEQHPNYLTSINNLALLYSKSNKSKEALLIYEMSVEILNKNTTLNFEWLNDTEKELFWNKRKEFYNTINQFTTSYLKELPQATIISYNSNLFTKGKLLEAKICKENDLAEIVELREKLSFLRKKLAKLEGSNDLIKYKKIEEEANILDSKLTQMWDEYATQKKNLSITWDQVQANLTGNEAAIEFVRYKSDKDSQYYYNALIVRKTDVYPILVPLCSENQLKGILNKGFSAYYSLVWAPIDGYLKEIKTIYYSPVGLLNTIPFAALYPQKNGGDEVTFDKKTKKIVSKTESDANYLMNRYTLHQLSSTRYLAMGLKENSTNKIDKSIALIGGVNYDFIPGESKKTIKKEMQLASREANISKPLEYLQGTKIEVETIGKSMQKNGWSTSLLENDSATEDNLIKFENQAAKGILHIATHGFAFPNIKELPPNSDSSISKNNFCYYTNPLQRCGLILAGANWTWMGRDDLKNKNPEAEDGILTAAQVALLNLRKTKLVVLSACETGLGKIEGSEGVIGLTRAFKLAGVEQLIVSLWEVPDKETMELMTIFYEDLSRTQNAIISFEKAQKIMSLKYPTRPDMWAGFVLIR